MTKPVAHSLNTVKVSFDTASLKENAAIKHFVFDEKLSSKDIRDLTKEMASWHDAKNGAPILNIRSKDMLRRANYPMLQILMDKLNIDDKDAVQFKTTLSRFNGSVDEFLKVYEKKYEKPINDNVVQKPQKAVVIPLNNEPKPKAKTKKTINWQHHFQMSKKAFFNFLLSHKKLYKPHSMQLHLPDNAKKQILEKKAKILAYKKTFLKKHKTKLKVAAAALPFMTLGYLGYKQAAKPEPMVKINNITLSEHAYNISQDLMMKAQDQYAALTDFSAFRPIIETSQDSEDAFWNLNARTGVHAAINEEDFDIQIPLIKNDILHNAPNVDFFNFCFKTYNEGDHYGISTKLYSRFMKENSAIAAMYNIPTYRYLNEDHARIIAKAQIYDKYGIAYMTNKSIAAAFYDALLMNSCNVLAANTLTQGLSDYLEVSNKKLTESQKTAIDNVAHFESAYISPAEWQKIAGVVNDMADDNDGERMMFETMTARLNEAFADKFEAKKYAYEPAMEKPHVPCVMNDFADNIMIGGTKMPTVQEYSQLAHMQKEKDMEAFSNIYMQCCYENFVKLEYGQKNQTFREANETLRKHGLNHLSSRYYCAGMSIAGLCQAADIFKELHPNSPVSRAVSHILSRCRNVHYCRTLKSDLNLLTKEVTYATSLESAVKNHMQNNKHAIVFAWAPRGGGNYHHLTLFKPAEVASNDIYTCCAYNRQRWGNERTFARYMKSRSEYGNDGYFTDIGAGISKLAEKFMSNDIRCYEKELNEKRLQQQKEEQERMMTLNPVLNIKSFFDSAFLQLS